ncbi:hypothetical protein OG455_07455 [Kitasatospora sp. NBC_01287]|uniref:hypothetical protein n=1 Tax=Kitasatospora sp. NBC_01287 TaxID=2903573 RepID=UPI00225A81C9|nr:hypothetical protein [Kitasatospora sp. NBC_01287]MCX4745361.1 hypothetical protein [Kitasatospora sp. NBC_01287]
MDGVTDDASAPYCAAPAAADTTLTALAPAGPAAGPRADCVLCGETTEHPVGTPGSTQCPRCAWQQAQRGACSG